MKSSYSEFAIESAKNNAALHGFDRSNVSSELAVAFLDWYFLAKDGFSSVEDTKTKQKSFWENHLARGD